MPCRSIHPDTQTSINMVSLYELLLSLLAQSKKDPDLLIDNDHPF
jgi:hypothetical protein